MTARIAPSTFEACWKVQCPAEADLIAENIRRMQKDLETARGRVTPVDS
jgi:hypothetical protein